MQRHIGKIPQNIFKNPELELEEEAPLLWVVQVGVNPFEQ
jgi:hypothetical protein